LDGGGGGEDEDVAFGRDWWRFEQNAGVLPHSTFAQGQNDRYFYRVRKNIN
jgi:hypothetical protein